ncbi:MAG: nitroreductase family deazaflavin-dependent oxidoreductase [Ardenticatenales bacterium]|nr:nitroreductase family deazaflavin-dependent oxidoreductase [Ardenticatenales bacterium]
MTQIASPLHIFTYRLTGGKVGGTLMGENILLLTTTGRKTGKERTLPLLYIPDGDRMVIVASNGGQARHPAWYFNLRQTPNATVEIGREKLAVRAQEAMGSERERLWALVTSRAPAYEQYREATTRQIPLMVLQSQGKL